MQLLPPLRHLRLPQSSVLQNESLVHQGGMRARQCSHRIRLRRCR